MRHITPGRGIPTGGVAPATKMTSCRGVQSDGIPELLEPMDVMCRELHRGQPIEVACAQVLVRDAITQDVVHRDEEAVRDRDDRSLLAAPSRQTAELGPGIGAFLPRPGQCRLGQCPATAAAP